LPEAFDFFQQILNGVEYCHAHLICHRDLKPENLLLDAQKHVKIADWGMASLMKKGSLLETSCGSPHYASPEVVMGKKYDGRSADIWSMGVVLYALLTGRLPFDDDNMQQLLAKVKTGVFAMPEWLPRDVQDLLSRMLTVEPAKRITLQQIKAHSALSYAARPYVEKHAVPLELKIGRPIEEVLDEDIVQTLRALGWENLDELRYSLRCPEPTVEKVFYRLLHKRKLKREKRHNVTRMEEAPTEDESPSEWPSRTTQPRTAPLPIRGGSSRAPREELSESPIIGSSPKKTWFSNFFGSFKEPSFGSSSPSTNPFAAGPSSLDETRPPPAFTVHSTKPSAQLMLDLKQALKTLHAVFTVSNDTLHVKYDAPDVASAVTFSARVCDASTAGSAVLILRHSGDKLTFQSLCDKLQFLL